MSVLLRDESQLIDGVSLETSLSEFNSLRQFYEYLPFLTQVVLIILVI